MREATASEPLSLQDEYENQASWRAARDKLTFIVCAPLEAGPGETASGETTASVRVRGGDAEDRTRGDVNLFLHAAADGDDDEGPTAERRLEGEVDVMIAAWEHRGRGLGGEAVRGLLAYLWRHRDEVLAEQQQPRAAGGADARPARLVGVMAKVQRGNAASRALFGALGFRRRGAVDYFGELTLAMPWDEVGRRVAAAAADGQPWLRGYREMAYE